MLKLRREKSGNLIFRLCSNKKPGSDELPGVFIIDHIFHLDTANKNLSSLVQRQSERQGIFFVALSPFIRGAGGVKLRLCFD